MLDALDKPVHSAVPLLSADTAPPPSDAAPLEIKVEPADAIFGSLPPKDLGSIPPEETEKTSTPRIVPLFVRFLRFAARTAVVAFLCALAWAMGAYYSRGHSSVDLTRASQTAQVQQSPVHDGVASAMQQMADEIRALKTSVDGHDAAQDADLASLKKNAPDPAQHATGAAAADLAGRIDKLETDLTTSLSQVNQRLASIEQQMSASHAAALAARRQLARRHAEHVHDAFDPSQDPAAPGAPRPLGAR